MHTESFLVGFASAIALVAMLGYIVLHEAWCDWRNRNKDTDNVNKSNKQNRRRRKPPQDPH